MLYKSKRSENMFNEISEDKRKEKYGKYEVDISELVQSVHLQMHIFIYKILNSIRTKKEKR